MTDEEKDDTCAKCQMRKTLEKMHIIVDWRCCLAPCAYLGINIYWKPGDDEDE